MFVVTHVSENTSFSSRSCFWGLHWFQVALGTAMYIIPPLTYHDAHIAGSQLGEICNTILYARREKTIFTARNQLFPQFLLRDGWYMICKPVKNDNGLVWTKRNRGATNNEWLRLDIGFGAWANEEGLAYYIDNLGIVDKRKIHPRRGGWVLCKVSVFIL